MDLELLNFQNLCIEKLLQNEVYPILKEKHDEFDSELSGEDLTTLQNLRAENKAIKQQQSALKKEMRAERKNGEMDREVLREKYGERMRGLRQNQKTIMNKLKPIVKNNQELVKSTAQEIMEYKEEWQAQRKAIAEKHDVNPKRKKGKSKRKKRTDIDEENEPRKRGRRGERAERGERGKGKRGQRQGRGQRAIASFLLWDGTMKSVGEVDENAAQILEEQPQIEQNFPNPAMNNTRINFKLPKESENVQLIITSMDGKVMTEQVFKQLSAGEHQLDVDVSNWGAGVYFYTIQTEGFKETKKMSVR